MKTLLTRIKTISPALYFCSLAHLALFAVMFVISLFDHRQLLGINLWIKPMKFALSIALYGLTWPLLLQYLPFAKAKRRFENFTAFAMIFEMAAIASQAARGELSHFNIGNLYGLVLFQLMGVVIVGQTLFALYIGFLFFKVKANERLSSSLLWGMRLGIIITCVLALEGGVMGRNLSHTVGAKDGGAGMPVVNWSRTNGDLRIAHFAGLHALQLLPLFALFVSRQDKRLTIAFGLFYLTIVSWIFINAMQGKPLL